MRRAASRQTVSEIGQALDPGESGSAVRVDQEQDELEDLIFSWRRLTDPRLRKIALNVIRSMAG